METIRLFPPLVYISKSWEYNSDFLYVHCFCTLCLKEAKNLLYISGIFYYREDHLMYYFLMMWVKLQIISSNVCFYHDKFIVFVGFSNPHASNCFITYCLYINGSLCLQTCIDENEIIWRESVRKFVYRFINFSHSFTPDCEFN